MVRHLTIDQYAADYEARPEVDGRDVTLLIPAAVSQVLDIADTWLGSDGAPTPRAPRPRHGCGIGVVGATPDPHPPAWFRRRRASVVRSLV
jgi:hypothetical protein